MACVQRKGALRVTCSYRTVSESATLVVGGIIPIDLLARERKPVFTRKAEVEKATAKKEARIYTRERWKERWDSDTKGRWTARLINQLDTWLDRDHGEVNYYLTQLLTGHGYFRAYLYRMKKTNGAECRYCGHDRDDAEHTFFNCTRWDEIRQRLNKDIRHVITPDNLIEIMLKASEHWDKVAVFVETVLRTKKCEERTEP